MTVFSSTFVQHVLERGKPQERNQIINKLSGQVVQMSQHKFASNVIEKCLEYGSSAERERLIMEIVGQSEGNENLLVCWINYGFDFIKISCCSIMELLLIDVLICICKLLHSLQKFTLKHNYIFLVNDASQMLLNTVLYLL